MGRARSIAPVLAMLAAVAALAGCGSGGGDSGNDGAEGPATTTEAPTTTTEAPVADVTGDWTMTLTIAETEPPGVELSPENQRKERALTLTLGDCPAPDEVVQNGDPAPGNPTLTAGEGTGDCVGAADVALRDFVVENLPLLATDEGFTVSLHTEALCFDPETGVSDPNSTYSKESVYAFAATGEPVGGAASELTGTLTETDGADNTCPSLAGATALTYDLVAVPA